MNINAYNYYTSTYFDYLMLYGDSGLLCDMLCMHCSVQYEYHYYYTSTYLMVIQGSWFEGNIIIAQILLLI